MIVSGALRHQPTIVDRGPAESRLAQLKCAHVVCSLHTAAYEGRNAVCECKRERRVAGENGEETWRVA